LYDGVKISTRREMKNCPGGNGINKPQTDLVERVLGLLLFHFQLYQFNMSTVAVHGIMHKKIPVST